MALTLPTTEQLRFRSQNTGTHNLDTYLEAAEKGGRSLSDLLDEIFDANGDVDTGIFQFRVNTGTYALQVRAGQYANANAGWVDVPDGSFFNPTGNYQVGYNYEIHDLFHYNDNLYMVTIAHTSGPLPDPLSTFVAVAGAAGSVPQTKTQLAGQAGKFLQVNQSQSGYDLVSFAESPVFFGLKMDGANLQVVEDGREEARSPAALLQSLGNYVNGVSDPMVTDGFWDLTFNVGGNNYRYFDADLDGDVAPDVDDLTALSNIISGAVTSGDYYNEWNNTILQRIDDNLSTYQSMIIPYAYGSDYPLYSKVPVSTTTKINPDDYLTWMVGSGTFNLAVENNNLVIKT